MAGELLRTLAVPMPMLFALALAAQPVDAQRVLTFLNRTIAWNERIDAQAQLADQPTDVLYVNDDRQIGRQVVARRQKPRRSLRRLPLRPRRRRRRRSRHANSG